MEATSSDWFLEGLGAPGPEASLSAELMLFGQFVGDWDIVECRYLQDGQWVTKTGRVHWRWILGGRAVQDVWMYRDEETRSFIPSGTTIRFYDTQRGLWRSVWFNPLHHDVDLFIGRKEGEDIVLELQEESKREGDGDIRWIFSHIMPESFRWRAEESKDGGKTWNVDTEMTIVRRHLALRSAP